MDLSKISTCELVKELEEREGVATYCIAPHEEEYKLISIDVETKKELGHISDIGPAKILIVTD